MDIAPTSPPGGRRDGLLSALMRRVPSHGPLRTALEALAAIVLVYLFLVSVKLMGEGCKAMGEQFALGLRSLIEDPVGGLLVGILFTSIVQSSSMTTSTAVAWVGKGIIPLPAAVPMVMGANIGTSVTNMIVAFGHVRRGEEFRRALAGASVHDIFNVLATLVLFPIELITRAWFGTGFLRWLSELVATQLAGSGADITFASPVKAVVGPVANGLLSASKSVFGSAEIGGAAAAVGALGLLFVSLSGLVWLLRSLVMGRLERLFDRVLFRNAGTAFVVGLVTTVMVQSSSVTTSVVVPLVGTGMLTVPQVFPYMLGANVGTTITAFLASFAEGARGGLMVAMVHLMFNLLGIALLYPLRRIPIALAHALGRVSVKAKRYAVLYVLGLFYGIPGLIIILRKLL